MASLIKKHLSRKVPFRGNLFNPSFIVSILLIYSLSYSNAAEWRILPIRSEEEFNQGRIGGEAEQHPHSIARSQSNPDIIYLSHDVGQVWKSIDGGDSWRRTLCKGLYLICGQSIEVDPVDPDTVFFIVSHSYNWLQEEYEGLYRSQDGGVNWEFVLPTDTNYDSSRHRMYRHNIEYDPSSIGSSGAERWYAAFPSNGLFRSEDGGDTWNKVNTWEDFAVMYEIECHLNDGQTIYAATDKGLYRSTNRGVDMEPFGNLPAGHVSSIEIHPQNPDVLYATVLGEGLYKSENSGNTFELIRNFDAARVFLNPGYPDTLYLTGISANTITTHDGGNTWITDMVTVPFPGLGRSGSGWKGRIAGQLSGIVPNPQSQTEAVAFSRGTLWKTTDGGQTFNDSSTLFTGYAWSWWNDGLVFDPYNPDRFLTFNCDVGMCITNNRGDWFDRRNDQGWGWYSQGLIGWFGTHAGDFQPVEGSNIIVASIGRYFSCQLMRSTDEGRTWELVTQGSENVKRNLVITFHPNDPNLVFAGNKVSYDAGATFQNIDFGQFNGNNPEFMGMCPAQPDTIYALGSSHRAIRSDDRGQTWRLYADSSTGMRFTRLDSLPTFAVDPQDPNKIYGMDSRYDLAMYDGTAVTSFGVLDLAGGVDMNNHVRTVAIDPRHPEILYAGMFSAGLPCAFRSTDGGETWEDITFNLPHTGISAMSVSPHTGELLRGSAFGTWVYPPPYESANLIYDKCVSIGGYDGPDPEPEQPEPEQPKPEPEPESESESDSESEPHADMPDTTALHIKNNIIKKSKNISATIEYLLKEAGNLSIKIYDAKGREIITLYDGYHEAGIFNKPWNGTDSQGNYVGSGIYLVHMESGSYSETKKIAVIK